MKPRTRQLPPGLNKDWMTITEAKIALGCHRETVRRMLKDGRLSYADEDYLNRRLIRRSSVEALLRRRHVVKDARR